MIKHADFIIIGAAILDILVQPVTSEVFFKGSVPAEQIAMLNLLIYFIDNY
ncbi:MAG: hypothetical protein HFH63_14025 [Lachnospiraceae bacterium]|nr:hypothetical protein [Lachnospiraceae bacterium]